MACAHLSPGQRMHMNQEVVAFDGRLWWVDVSWGAVSADPFGDRPELRHVEPPEGSTLPDQEGGMEMWKLIKNRRMGISGGRLHYTEVSQEEPFLIKSFALDDESGRWTLSHLVSFAALLAHGGCSSVPFLGAIDPLDADMHAVHLAVDREVNLAVDMRRMKVLAFSLLGEVRPSKCASSFLLPCVLPPWLESSSIPSAVRKGRAKNKTSADVLVRSDRDQKR